VRLLDLIDLLRLPLSLTSGLNTAAEIMSSEMAALEKEIQEYRLQVESCHLAHVHS
jgi:hypothetical protein